MVLDDGFEPSTAALSRRYLATRSIQHLSYLVEPVGIEPTSLMLQTSAMTTFATVPFGRGYRIRTCEILESKPRALDQLGEPPNIISSLLYTGNTTRFSEVSRTPSISSTETPPVPKVGLVGIATIVKNLIHKTGHSLECVGDVCLQYKILNYGGALGT